MDRTRCFVARLLALGGTLFALALVGMLLTAGIAAAATCTDTFTNTGVGDWDDASNWSAGVPTSTSNVCIEQGTAQITDGDISPIPVASLDIGSGSSSAELDVAIHDVVTSSATTIGSHGTLVLNGTYTGSNGGNASLGGGTVQNAGTIVMEGTGYGSTLYGTVLNQGTISVPSGTGNDLGMGGNGGPGSLDNQGTIDIAAGAELDVFGFPVTDDAGGSIVNDGTLTMRDDNGTNGAYTQGAGTESGNPIELYGSDSVAYTGSGASSIETHTNLTVSGNLAAGQSLQADIGDTLTWASSFTNAGTITLAPNYYGGGGGPATIALSSGTMTNAGTIIAESNNNNPELSGNIVNEGVVSIAAGTTLEQVAGGLTNASTGILEPQISSANNGSLQFDTGTTFAVGGTLAPVLTGGFVPTVDQAFNIANMRGGTYTGTFASVKNDFGADYSNSSHIDAVYGETPAPTPTPTPTPKASTPHVVSISGGREAVTVKISCPSGGGGCVKATITVTSTEHRKGTKIVAVSAAGHKRKPAKKKVVTIASANVSLAAGSERTITLTLNATGRKLLSGRTSLPASVVVRVGTAKLAGKTVKVTAKRKHHKRHKKHG